MNRRSFFRTIVGFAGGVVAAFVPKKEKYYASGVPSTSPSISASNSVGESVKTWRLYTYLLSPDEVNEIYKKGII